METLKAGIVHNYHHSVCTEKYLHSSSSYPLLDNIVFEGKAVMFEKIVYPDISLTAVNYTFIKDNWKNVEPDLFQYDSNRA